MILSLMVLFRKFIWPSHWCPSIIFKRQWYHHHTTPIVGLLASGCVFFKAFLIGLVQKGPLCWEPRAGKCPFKAWSRSGYIAMQCLLQPLFTSFKKYVFKSLHFMDIMIQVHLLFCCSTTGMAGWVLCISCFYHSSQHQVAAWQACKSSITMYVHFSIHFSQSSFWKACKSCGCVSQFTFVTLLHMMTRCVFF